MASDLDVAFDGPPDGSSRGSRCRPGAPTGGGGRPAGLPVRRPGRQRRLPVPRVPRRGQRRRCGRDRRSTGPASSTVGFPTRRTRTRSRSRDVRRRVRAPGRRSSEFDSFAPEQLEALFTTGDAGPPPVRPPARGHRRLRRAVLPQREHRRLPAPRVLVARVRGGPRRGGGHVPRRVRGAPQRRHRRRRGGHRDVAGDVRDSTTLEITPAPEVDRKIDSGIDVIVDALALCALAAALAGGFAVAQALARHFAIQIASDRSLAALGMTRFDRLATQAITTVPMAVLGALARSRSA